MKIAIIGYSGAGKSTLAKELGAQYGCEVLHLDNVHFAADWAERSDADMVATVEQLLQKESWIVEGNYSRILYQRRMEEADRIVILALGRLTCLWRAYRRYRMYKGRARPDMAAGCNEKFDGEFVRWILWDGRSKSAKERYRAVMAAFPGKTVVLKNQRQIDRFLKGLHF